jgi:hypothetical protein
VKPLYKKGCQTDVANYRPVSLISVFSKIVERIMHKRLLSFLNNHNIINNRQYGFCKGKTAKTAIAEFLGGVYKSLDEREISIGLFLDLTKAFYLVNHDILLRKMERMGIRGVAINWFRTYLEKREQKVEITYRCKEANVSNSYLSHSRPVRHGIPQGSVLGPILFLIYINDLEVGIEQGKPTFFADDTSIFISGNSVNVVQRKIDVTINKLTEWFERNRLIINKRKNDSSILSSASKYSTRMPINKAI